jgi:hypothetical protein
VVTVEVISLVADVATVLAVAVAAAGLFYTGRQMDLARKAAGTELLFQIDALLREHDETFQKLQDGTLRGDEWEVQRVMGYMERLNVLIATGLVAPEVIEDLHGWRLENLMSNNRVRARVAQFPAGWRQLTELDQRLSEYRAQSRKEPA